MNPLDLQVNKKLFIIKDAGMQYPASFFVNIALIAKTTLFKHVLRLLTQYFIFMLIIYL